MMKPRIGICVFVESTLREEVYRARNPIAEEEVRKVVSSLKPYVDIAYQTPKGIRCKRDVFEAIEGLRAAKVDCSLFMVPIWTTPAHVVTAAQLLGSPVLLLGNDRKDSISQTGLLAAGGALHQAGITHKRIVGNIDDKEVLDRLLSCLRTISTVSRLRGQTYGCIGGRSLGIVTGSADESQWQRMFGVDIEHVDQSVLMREAEAIDSKLVNQFVEWVRGAFGSVEIEPTYLHRQVRSYLATRKLIKELDLDFVGIKCQTDLSDWYCLQCLNVSLLGDTYDAMGPKTPTVCSCEADCDGALTMQILTLLSGGKPSALMDIRAVTSEGLELANCGAAPTWFACRADDSASNAQAVKLTSHVFGKAGGASLDFIFGCGEVTLARLCRHAGTYWMSIVPGKISDGLDSSALQVGGPFPRAFVETKLDREAFIETFGSNHIHVAPGNLVQELQMFCDFVGMSYRVY